MHTLTNYQKGNVQLLNQRLGLGPDAHLRLNEIIKATQQNKQNLIFSDNPLESDVPPMRVSVNSIRDLKALIGVEDGRGIGDAHISYPPPIGMERLRTLRSASSSSDLLESVDEPFLFNVRQARTAYILGDSRKVMDYEPVINDLMFPSRLTVFTGQELNVPAGEVYTIKGDGVLALNFEQITLGKGAEIKIPPGAIINTQSFTQL